MVILKYKKLYFKSNLSKYILNIYMPYAVRKIKNQLLWKTYNLDTKKIYGIHDTKIKALKQMKLLRFLTHH